MMNEMRDRLVELLKKADENCDRKYIMDYEDAIVNIAEFLVANGVIVPPMRLGQMCYEPYHSNWSSEVRPHRVSSVTQKADGSFKIRLTNLITKSVGEITPNKIGKTVFLTKDQAEQKLKEMRGDKNA